MRVLARGGMVAAALVVAAAATAHRLPRSDAPTPPAQQQMATPLGGSAYGMLFARADTDTDDASAIHRCRRVGDLEVRTARGLSTGGIRTRMQERRASLGSATLGTPTRGALFNGVALQASDGLEPVAPTLAFGTEGTVRSIERAVAEVRCRHPGTPKLFLGSISREGGGPLSPHKSHQSGLDADLGYYYAHGEDWYTQVDETNLDRERTWALVDALVAGGNVEYIFVSRRVKEMLRQTAAIAGARESRLVAIFDGTPTQGPIVRAIRGHNDHLHVRFIDVAARDNGVRLAPHLPPHLRRLIR